MAETWQDHLKEKEKQRLADLHARRALKEKTLREISGEIAVMMRRAIARKRRAEGKE